MICKMVPPTLQIESIFGFTLTNHRVLLIIDQAKGNAKEEYPVSGGRREGTDGASLPAGLGKVAFAPRC